MTRYPPALGRVDPEPQRRGLVVPVDPACRVRPERDVDTPLRLWIDPPEGWRVSSRLLTAPQGDRPETAEARQLDFEVEVPPSASGRTRLPAYALYNVCEDERGVCLFRRQDLVVEVDVQVKP